MLMNRIRRTFPILGLAGALLALVLSGTAGAASPPVGDWRMDTGSGTILVDSSTFGNNGTILGNPTWVAGQHGLALRMDGTGDYATVPDSASLDMTTADHDGRVGEAGEDGHAVPDQEGDDQRHGWLRAVPVVGREGVRTLEPGRERRYVSDQFGDLVSGPQHDVDACRGDVRGRDHAAVRERCPGRCEPRRPGVDHVEQPCAGNRCAVRRSDHVAGCDGRRPLVQHGTHRLRDRGLGDDPSRRSSVRGRRGHRRQPLDGGHGDGHARLRHPGQPSSRSATTSTRTEPPRSSPIGTSRRGAPSSRERDRRPATTTTTRRARPPTTTTSTGWGTRPARPVIGPSVATTATTSAPGRACGTSSS